MADRGVRRALITLAVAGSLLAIGCTSDDGDDLARFCSMAAEMPEDNPFTSFDPLDLEASRAMFRDIRSKQAEIRPVTPEAVRADLDIVIDYVEDLLSGLEAAPDDGTRPAIYEELLPRYDAVDAAGERIGTYVEANC